MQNSAAAEENGGNMKYAHAVIWKICCS